MLSDRIHRARVLKRMTLQELADAMGVTKQALSKFETGKDVPNSTRLIQMAKLLGVKPEYFFRPYSVELNNVEFRKQSALSAKDRDAIIEQTRDSLERYLILESFFEGEGLPRQFSYKARYEVNSLEDAEKAAEQLRKHWRIGFDAIENLTELLEEQGLKVVALDTPEKFDGLCAEVGPHSVVILNKNRPGDRQRFTAAHELGHLVMRISPKLDEEKACHRFAGAFLFPAECVKRELGQRRAKLHLYELRSLKEKYRVSMQVVMRRALEQDVLTAAGYKSMNFLFGKFGYRKQEPGNQLPSEHPERFNRLAYRAVAEGMVSPSRAAELLHVPVKQVLEMAAVDSEA
jgi:Zn-dependent peptidase ImmA (M78 family)/DNA-binding XRE family transcriptional regulator